MSILLYFLSTLTCAPLWAQSPTTHEVTVISNHFTLYGKTNVNAFECSLEHTSSSDPIVVKSTWSDYKISFQGLDLRFPISSFDCGLEAMSNELKSILKSEEYPYLSLSIHEIKIKSEEQEIEKLTVDSSVTITLGGVSRSMHIEEGLVINHSENTLTLTGKKLLNMKDFDIDPPVKFWGMVKVESELNVAFEIKMLTQKPK